jgi:GNAT superfamily N-acetyltransferase
MMIRELAGHDLGDLLALYAHLHRQDATLPDETAVQGVWREILENQHHRIFGGHVGDTLVSSCALTIVPNLTRGCRPYGLIENVVTHAAHRNRGYGKAILAYALDHAWAAGCYKVMLLTGKQDEATLRFYEAAGFDGDEKRGFIAKPPMGE